MRPPPGISIRKEPYTADDLARNVARFTVTLTPDRQEPIPDDDATEGP